MNTLRKITLFIVTPVLGATLLLLLITWALLSFLGRPQPIKQTLADSKIYDHLLTTVLTDADQGKKNPKQPKEDINFDQPEIKAAAEKAFTPEFLQESTEKVIDGVYGWLDGSTPEPQFMVDISKSKQTFIESVADAAVKRVETLPLCTTPDQLNQLAQNDDPFAATCRPPTFNAAAEKQKFLAQVKTDEGPLKDDSFSFADLQKQGEKPITQKFEQAPKIFQFAKILPIILSILAVVLTALIFLLTSPHTKALRVISKVFLSVGISALILTLIAWFMSTKVTGSTKNQLETDLVKGVQTAFGSFRNSLLIGSIVYTVIGIASWLVAKRLDTPLTEAKKMNNINTVLGTKELTDKDAVPLEAPTPEKPEETPKADKQE